MNNSDKLSLPEEFIRFFYCIRKLNYFKFKIIFMLNKNSIVK